MDIRKSSSTLIDIGCYEMHGAKSAIFLRKINDEFEKIVCKKSIEIKSSNVGKMMMDIR